MAIITITSVCADTSKSLSLLIDDCACRCTTTIVVLYVLDAYTVTRFDAEIWICLNCSLYMEDIKMYSHEIYKI